MWKGILGVICPGRCTFCHAPSGSEMDLCQFCADTLPVSAASCYYCARPLPPGASAGQAGTDPHSLLICGQCVRHRPPVRRTVSRCLYAYPAERLVHLLKFGHTLRHARTMGLLLAEQLRQSEMDLDLVIPVPLSRRRYADRGFNQAAEIARYTCHSLGLSLCADTLVRTRHQLPQAELGREQRRKNVRGVFACSGAVQGLRCALVDDVMTTGATVFEAARVLNRAGARSVDAWVFARTA